MPFVKYIQIALGLLVCFSLLPRNLCAQNTRIESFAKAKKLSGIVYRHHPFTFYCDCPYQEQKINFAACSYAPPRKSAKKANDLQWEHVVPAENFGRSFAEWREGHLSCMNRNGKKFKGRNCARKTSREFRLMEADLYNLVPEIASLNRARSNYQVGMIAEEKREFGTCDVEIKDRTFEPRPEIRGDIARTYFYMDWVYPGRGIVSRQLRQLLEIWHREDPPDVRERERAKRIEKLQGNKNPFVK